MGFAGSKLIPMNEGGDAIPLVKDTIVMGRRPDCDICLPHSVVSGKHCHLRFEGGVWIISDLRSSNGVRVNGDKVLDERRIFPGDVITVARRFEFKIEYENNNYGDIRIDDLDEVSIFDHSLLARAGLERARPNKSPK